MKSRILGWLFCCLSLTSVAAPHNDPSIGVHGMVLSVVDDQLVASHMPLQGAKHAHQILLHLDVPADTHASIKSLVERRALVTIEPETFSLDQLRQGEMTHFEARLVAGHFERGGKTAKDNIEFSVLGILLDKPLSTGSNKQFYLVPLAGDNALLVHRIGQLPSFDQLIWLKLQTRLTSSLLTFDDELPVTPGNLPNKMAEMGAEYYRQLYLEYDDFTR